MSDHLDTVPPSEAMPRDLPTVLRIRIDLADAQPPIWRRLDLRSDLTLDVVHQVIQDAFGWEDAHLHRFALGGSVWDRDAQLFLCPYDVAEGEDQGTPEEQVRLDQVLNEPGDVLEYVYDYGDDWQLRLRLEKILPSEPGTPPAVCVDGRRAAPPEDSRFEYMNDGLATLVEDPDRFEPAEVNELLERPWYVLRARGMHPRLLELVNVLSMTSDGAELGARLAALPDPPAKPSDDELRTAFSAHLWFLDRAGDGGVPLTAAGYLRPAVVEEAARLVPTMANWIGKGNREDLTVPVANFRESLVKQLKLLRKYKGALHLTRAGAAARDRPAVLFDHLAASITPPQERGRFTVDADLLVLAYAAVTPDGELPLDRIAAHLTDLGYLHDDGRPVAGHVLHQYEANVHDILVNVDAPPTGRRARSQISAIAAALAGAALHH
ncbi:plasmid pRiA4b ORF-3 family protein [Promicromonospora sp. CA-289599]|uniref:plasmid pRiA4b ORF-3 family protein n=1 Tax=Promicromonospora sp. CA-289599 TaxID=3240014 RepID=UPI003D89C931